MNTLLTFDSTQFVKHLVKEDDRRMVDYIIREYGPALQEGISYLTDGELYGGSIDNRMRWHYNDAYLKATLSMGNTFCDNDTHDARVFIRRTIDEEGQVTGTKARYDELVETCITHFNSQVVAVLRSIQFQDKRIYTVDVVGYENHNLKILLKTDGAFVP